MKLKVTLASFFASRIDGEGEPAELTVELAGQLLEDGAAEVRVMLPGFTHVHGTCDSLAQRFAEGNLFRRGLPVPFGNSVESVDVYRAIVPHPRTKRRLTFYLFRCPKIFDATDATGRMHKETPEKVIFFCRAVLEFIRTAPRAETDVIHCNEWHTGLIPVYLRTLYHNDPLLRGVATVYTTHNAGGGFQGSFADPMRWLALAGLQKCDVFRLGHTLSLEHLGRLSFTKGGLGFADLVNTVSRHHRTELRTASFGGLLEGVLRERDTSFEGIQSGIDHHQWDPASDPLLKPANFSDAASKREARHPLRCKLRQWCAADLSRPFERLGDELLFIAVTPITFQKMPILLRTLARVTDNRRSQVVLLGDSIPGDAYGEGAVKELHRIAEREAPRVLFLRQQDETLAHLLFAASEIFLLPSVSEPSGSSALIAMRYGCIPIGRAVGALVDCIFDESDPRHRDRANGFLFREALLPNQMLDEGAAADALIATAQRAARLFREKPKRWTELVRNALHYDSSWAVPSVRYLHLYREATRRATLRDL